MVITRTYLYGKVTDNNTTVSSGTKTITDGGATITVTNVNASTFNFQCGDGETQFSQFVVYYLDSAPQSVAVTGVTLNPSTAQSIDVNGKVSFTATVAPDNASDKKVKWSVNGSAVTLYSDEACQTPLALNTATSTLVVYAKGMSAGTATVTATSNADITKSASCNVTVHAHSFTYAASGATITATCTAAGCDLPESSAGAGDHVATLTIAANGGTYDGTTAYAATITDANSIQGDAKVQYQKKTDGSYGTATETAPKDAGDYKASITVGGATASVEYTIAQADPTANAPTGLTATYGQTLADVSLEGKNPEGNTPGTWSWVDSTKSVGNVVTPAATFKATFTPTSSNYKTVENVEVAVTVNKAANPATVTGTATVIRGGNTVDLSGNVTKNGATGDVGYAIDGEANGCTLNGSVLTSGDTTGTVTVNVTVATDENYNALGATPITVTISDKGTQTISAENVTATYGDTDKSVSAIVTDPATGGGAISYAVKDGSGDYIDVDASTGALTIKQVPASGKAYVTVKAAETQTYAQAIKDVTVNISKIAPTADMFDYTAPADLTYDGTAKAATVAAKDAVEGMGAVTVKYYQNGTEAEPKDAKTYTVKIDVAEGVNYTSGSGLTADGWTFTVEPAEVTVSGITAADKPYDGNTNAALDYSKAVFSGMADGDTLTVTAVGTFDDESVGENKTVTLSELTLGGESAGNYVLAAEGQQETTTASITANELDLTVEGYTGIYDGEAHSISVTASENRVTVTYSETKDGKFTIRNPEYTDAGTYTVYYKAEKIGADTVNGAETVRIVPKEITVPSGIVARDKIYDGTTKTKLDTSNAVIDGALARDNLIVIATGEFASPEVGSNITVHITNMTLAGMGSKNYRLADTGNQTTAQANIIEEENETATGQTTVIPDETATPEPGETVPPETTETPEPEETVPPETTETPEPEETVPPETTETPEPEGTGEPDASESPNPEGTTDPGNTPSGNVNTEIENEDGGPEVDRPNLYGMASAIVDGMELSPDDEIEITLVNKPLDESEIPSEVWEQLQPAVENLNVDGLYLFDLSLIMTVNGIDVQAITETPEAVKLTIAIPEELKKEGRVFYLLRLHDGVLEVLGTATGDVVEGQSTFFSLYLLAYVDPEPTAEPTAEPTPEPTLAPIDPTKFNDVAVESDTFTFRVVWQGGSEKSIDFTLYKKDGTVYHHGFDKKVVSSTEWKYSAWFSSPEACYVIEKPMAGYQIRYENVGVYAQVTDRLCDGGTIINYKVPKTGDTADLALWAGMVAAGALILCGVTLHGKRGKENHKK